MYGIWDLSCGDWVREYNYEGHSLSGVLAFESKKFACRRAAQYFGFDSYAEAKRKGWCEVRGLPTPTPARKKVAYK